jgi:hypothetical protein
MSNEFHRFAEVVAVSFQRFAKTPDVFVANIDGNALWEKYLAAFPEGENPIFKTSLEHDCRCCKHFIRRIGNVVALSNNVPSTIWDRALVEAPPPYRAVAASLADAVRDAGIKDLFRVMEKERSFGAIVSRHLDKTGKALTWNHFYTGDIPPHLRSTKVGEVVGDYRTTVEVFRRGLTELSPESLDTVLSLIEANALYRGEEHKGVVVQFQKTQQIYLALEGARRDLFVWRSASGHAARFRNTVIGTLVQDLSEGQDVERAVKSFKTKVAPQNYKRTTAIITPGMIAKAMETIQTLGLESALERRFAVLGDISVQDVKWVAGAVKSKMKHGIGDLLLKHAAATASPIESKGPIEDIPIEEFVARVLPETTRLEVLFEDKHMGNLMSLTAPVHPEPKQLFRWANDFAWSYAGNVADSIAERVKKAGGKVDGVLRVSLSWFNYDDLDLHVFEPPSRLALRGGGMLDHIFFRNKRGWTGGELDVDMNAGSGTSREAVENVVWVRPPPDGVYRIAVHNYAFRESSDPGFVVELANDGRMMHFSYNKPVRNDTMIEVVRLYLKDGIVREAEMADPGITPSNISVERWGLRTGQYVKVSAVTLSPNFWGANAVGNKHTFFMLDGCRSDEPTRGFYNEFLHPRLEPHRKVFEVIGDKTKCRPSEEQLSGLGFSSTKKTSFTVKATQGKRQRLFNVNV